jgi:hypothetical protein
VLQRTLDLARHAVATIGAGREASSSGVTPTYRRRTLRDRDRRGLLGCNGQGEQARNRVLTLSTVSQATQSSIAFVLCKPTSTEVMFLMIRVGGLGAVWNRKCT